MEQRRTGSTVGGIVLVIVGGLFLISNLLGRSFASLAPYIGPAVPVGLGCYFLYRIYGPDRKPGTTPFPWPLFMILGGLFAMASIAGYWTYGLSFGPLALIITGVWLLVRRSR